MLTVQFISCKILYSQVKHLIKPQLKLNSNALDLGDKLDNLVYRWRNDCPGLQIILFIGVFGFKKPLLWDGALRGIALKGGRR